MRRSWSIALVTGLMAVACSSEASVGDPTTTPTTVPAAVTSTPAAPEPDPNGQAPTSVAPDEPAVPGSPTLPVIGGGTFDLTRLERGPVAMWFWAPG